MSSDPKKPVTIEDLLRLKRAERPPEAFWTQFESELRAKQLAAIGERRPWWSSWERVGQALARRSVPLGAAAALGVALVSFHEYRVRTLASGRQVVRAMPVSTAVEFAETAAPARASTAAVASPVKQVQASMVRTAAPRASEG